jgi:hypothetical protein
MVTGIESRAAAITLNRLFRRKEKTIDCSELPKTFFIPISFILDLARNKVRPNNPRAARIKVKMEKIKTIVLKFLSEK